MDQITITRDQFKQAAAEEVTCIVKCGEDGSQQASVIAGMLCSTFAAGLFKRLFDTKKEEE